MAPATTRAARLCAGKRPRSPPSPRPSPRPRLPREEGSPRRRGPSGGELSQLLSAKGVRLYGNLLPRGAGLTRGLRGGRGGGVGAAGCPWASRASLRTLPSARGGLLDGEHDRN